MKTAQTLLVVLTVVGASSLVACGPSLYRQKPESPVLNDAVTAMWEKDIKANAQSGDWILTRSYSAIGDAIVLGTSGEEVSHSVLYDAETETIIEAVSGGVKEVPLRDLLARNRVAIVVRPHDTTAAARRASIEKARSVIGADFDTTGLIGLQVDSKFYCSELVVWAANIETDALVVTPASLLLRGQIIYYSGVREDAQVQSAAVMQSQRAEPAVRTASR